MATLKIAKDLFDLLYPIGTYYETSNANWTPSSAGWYGTWVEDTAGKTTVAKDSGTFNTLGASIGSENEDISHTHSLSNNGGARIGCVSGKMYYDRNWVGIDKKYNQTITNHNFDHVNDGAFTGNLSTTLCGNTDNKSLSCNIIQPSIVVRRWHRTA